MFSDKFKKELDTIHADPNLISRARQKAAGQRNPHENPVTRFAKNKKFYRIAAAVCSLVILVGIGIFFGSGTGMSLTARLFGNANQKAASGKATPVNEPFQSAADAMSDNESEGTHATESKDALTNGFHDGSIYNCSNYETILTVLEKNWALENDGYNFFGEKITGSVVDGVAPESNGDSAVTGATTAAAYSGDAPVAGKADYSQTNIQVEGVDEADIIKNDGEYIYCISNASLFVLDVRDPHDMKVAAKITGSSALPDFSLTVYYENYIDIFYDSDSKTLSLISNSYGSNDTVYPYTAEGGSVTSGDAKAGSAVSVPDTGSTAAAAPSGDTSSVGAAAPAAGSYNGMYPSAGYTILQSYDVSDPYAPKEIRTFFQEGNYLSSRRIDDTVYLITSQNLYYDGTVSAEDLMPSTSDGPDNWATVPAPDIFIINPNYADTFTVVSAVNTRDISKDTRTQAVVGQGNIVYSSPDTLYIAAAVWNEIYYQTYGDFSASSSKPDTAGQTPDDLYKTKILAFSITGGTLDAKTSGTISGTLLNQYSMDEYQGNLRIAATSGGWNSVTSNNIIVLDSNLAVISSLTGLAPGEQIYSARFAGDRIYLVTFLQVDPFFVIDASDPANLAVLGKLKIPGYSNYLQMLGDNTVLAIGNATYTSGGSVIPAGLKIAIFDVADPENPVMKSSLVYGTTFGSSDAQYNPKALLLNKARGLIGLPVSFDLASGSYGTDYINGYLLLHYDINGNLTHDYLFKDIDTLLSYGLFRGITIKDTIFLVGSSEIQAYSLNTYDLIDSLDFNLIG